MYVLIERTAMDKTKEISDGEYGIGQGKVAEASKLKQDYQI
jgi:hypothetical protein